jgi:diacylglycerol kinase (ATP)
MRLGVINANNSEVGRKMTVVHPGTRKSEITVPYTCPIVDDIPIILNTRAGATHASLGAEQLRRMARNVGFKAEIIEARSVDQMRATVRRLVREETPRLGVAGGDGTVRIAVQELAHSQTALGILSQGTFNNFATALRVPHNLPAALKALYQGEAVPVDLGRIGDRYFTESAGVGLFADGLAILGEDNHKNILRGLYTAFRVALSLRVHPMRITLDGVPYEQRVALCEVANIYRMGMGLPIAPEAELDDGTLDIVLIGDIQRRELLDYLRAVRAQLHVDLPKVTMLKAQREIRIESRRRRLVHCDDEVIGYTPVTITVEPNALHVLIAALGSDGAKSQETEDRRD